MMDLITTLVSLGGTNVAVDIPEIPVPYERVEFDAWRKARCSVFDRARRGHAGPCAVYGANAMDALLDRLGREFVMGRKRSVYYHQAARVGKRLSGYNFTEVKLGIFLAEKMQYPAENLVYENWRVSEKSKVFELALRPVPPRPGTRAAGTQMILNCFTPRFFALMAELMDLNRVSHETTVDIFGWHPALSECGFFEAKREDDIKRHQKMLFGFIAFLAKHRPGEVFRHLGMAVRSGVVRFSDDATDRSKAVGSHHARFIIPEEWRPRLENVV